MHRASGSSPEWLCLRRMATHVLSLTSRYISLTYPCQLNDARNDQQMKPARLDASNLSGESFRQSLSHLCLLEHCVLYLAPKCIVWFKSGNRIHQKPPSVNSTCAVSRRGEWIENHGQKLTSPPNWDACCESAKLQKAAGFRLPSLKLMFLNFVTFRWYH